MMWCDMLWCDMMWCVMMRCDMIHDVVWCDMMRSGVTLSGVVWHDVVWYEDGVWCGMTWCGVVWHDVVWFYMVWCDIIWCGVTWCDVVEIEYLEQTPRPSADKHPAPRSSHSFSFSSHLDPIYYPLCYPYPHPSHPYSLYHRWTRPVQSACPREAPSTGVWSSHLAQQARKTSPPRPTKKKFGTEM